MKSFFDGVRRHIGNMDAERLREQYRRLSDEVSSLDTLFSTIAQGIIVLDECGEVAKSNPAALTSGKLLYLLVRWRALESVHCPFQFGVYFPASHVLYLFSEFSLTLYEAVHFIIVHGLHELF